MAAACVQLSGPPLDVIKAPSPPAEPTYIRGDAVVVSKTGGSGPIGSRELHLVGAVSAASGSAARSASGRGRFGVCPGG